MTNKNAKREKTTLYKYFMSMLRVGIIGFGGGSALIPILHDKVVVEEKYISEEDFEEDVLIASITPGALPVEIAGGIGRRIAGWRGMLAGSYGMAIPGVFATILCVVFMQMINDRVISEIRFASVGISAFIICMLFKYIINAIRKSKSKKSSISIMLVTFFLVFGKNIYQVLGVNQKPWLSVASINLFIVAIFLLIICKGNKKRCTIVLAWVVAVLYIATKSSIGQRYLPNFAKIVPLVMLFMVAVSLYISKSQDMKNYWCAIWKNERKWDCVALFLIMAVPTIMIGCISLPVFLYVGRGILSSLISFGGGDAYLTIADGLFVNSGMVSETVFYGTIVLVVNVLPGSILCKTLCAVGYIVGRTYFGNIFGGVIVALLGLTVSIFASDGIFSIIHMIYGEMKDATSITHMANVLKGIISGLLLNVALSLMIQCKKIGDAVTGWYYIAIMLALFGIGLFLMQRKQKNIVIVLILTAMALVICNFKT